MSEEQFLETALLYLMDEMMEDEKIDFENLIFEDSKALKEFENIKEMHKDLLNSSNEFIDESVIETSRNQLSKSLNELSSKPGLLERFSIFIDSLLFSKYSFAYSGLSALVIGLLIGYSIFSGENPIENNSLPGVSLDAIKNGNVGISNIRFPSEQFSNGDIEIKFDAVQPISYKANSNDETIRFLLASTLVKSNNPWVRIKTINTLAQTPKNELILEPKIKEALISSIKNDENPVVRKEAISLLAKYPYDNDIRDAFLFTLATDDNAANRILAINLLADYKTNGMSIDNQMKKFLEQKIESNENGLIKNRAKLILGK